MWLGRSQADLFSTIPPLEVVAATDSMAEVSDSNPSRGDSINLFIHKINIENLVKSPKLILDF